MQRRFLVAGIIALVGGMALAQTTPAPTSPVFEVADVHVSPPTRFVFMRDPVIRRGRYEIRLATMVDLIRTAYGIEAERVLGGPNWLENVWFDVTAKVPEGTTTETARPMLRTLLADRFKLTFHNDTKSIPAYGLKAGKHTQLKEADGSGDPGCKFTPPTPPASGNFTEAPALSYACRNMTMAAFAQALHSTIFVAPQYLNERVVTDETELKGAWDFDFKFTPKGMLGPDGPMPGTITLFDAMEKLGLKLEPAVTPLPVIVVDSVNQKPTDNPPNVAEILHITPAPTEFEVAELKPTPPDFKGMRVQMQPGGRVNIAGVSVKFLIEQSWDLTDEMLSGAPKWMDTDRYDIVAKADIEGPQMDIDDLFPMLRALLTERFKLATHTEQRPATAYTLLAVKPKIKKADPASRTKYKEGPASDGKDPRDKNPILGRLVTCQNMTMAQFSEKLKSIAPGYIHSPVLDATGLEGGYDFTLSFSPVQATRAGGGRGGEGGPPPPGDANAGASDPTGAVTLFEAIDKQLGLKLEAQKRPVTVLVIDHAEQKPTEN
ncbi:MAG: TIGR03435 family protein [Bryobacteraceae bacterium]|jgi:uncharacterized protein (TIGR03435 family)